ncbi:serine/threonine-protein kinase [Candidatus Uabimicrobium amorphum]|uniref:Serine/threonine protein kinase n=1 Tax=Uabimicrobium amorphum TaxID=2596890 RepID=A0A5S9IT08_UABAM|nr:serine/threonine-protein kinase [Candidatus Uabimicrobium amorphum]BBM86600.1 serine/threonine protein kinase [Candidatus Uabimicrobium amorphum]
MDQNEDGDILLAMKLVKGVSWKDLLYPQTVEHKEKAREYNLQKHLEILINVCNAINYAHSKGIVHCDLKPDNIMIRDFGEVLVMDWGIAVDVRKNPDERRTFHKDDITTPMGTPCYMAPELAEGRGKDISFATDVYLLGGILYEIIHHIPPHIGKSLWVVLLAAKESKPVPFKENIPLQLRQICHKAMCKKSQDRYRRVTHFQKALEEYLQHRESISLSNKATELYNNAVKYAATQHKKPSTWQKIKRIVFDIPGKAYFPYWWFYSKKTGKILFVAYFCIMSTILFYCLKKLSTTSSMLMLTVPLNSMMLSNVVFLIWQIYRWLLTKSNLDLFISPKFSASYLYTNFIEAITLYQRAIDLWRGNQSAQKNKLRAHAKIAELALDFKDTRLAQTHIEKLKITKSTNVQDLCEKAEKVIIEEKSDLFMLNIAKFFFALATYALLLQVLSLPFYLSSIERFEAAKEENIIYILRSYSTSQALFKSHNVCDQNLNGLGEYGFLSELDGSSLVRGQDFSVKTPFIEKLKFKNELPTKNGYYFYCYLPGRTEAIGENDKKLRQDNLPILLQEQHFVIYAWPIQENRRAFVINEKGIVFQCTNHNYIGLNIPKANSAFDIDSQESGNLQGDLGGNTVDGNEWTEL